MAVLIPAISEADKSEIMAAISLIDARLPVVDPLSPLDRRRLVKGGGRRLGLLQQTLQAVERNGNIFPPAFRKADFLIHAAVAAQLNDINDALLLTSRRVGDATMLANSQAMEAAFEVYGYVRAASRFEPGMIALYQELSASLRQSGRRSPKPDRPDTGQ